MLRWHLPEKDSLNGFLQHQIKIEELIKLMMEFESEKEMSFQVVLVHQQVNSAIKVARWVLLSKK